MITNISNFIVISIVRENGKGVTLITDQLFSRSDSKNLQIEVEHECASLISMSGTLIYPFSLDYEFEGEGDNDEQVDDSVPELLSPTAGNENPNMIIGRFFFNLKSISNFFKLLHLLPLL